MSPTDTEDHLRYLLIQCDGLLSLIYHREGARQNAQTLEDIDQLLSKITPYTRPVPGTGSYRR